MNETWINNEFNAFRQFIPPGTPHQQSCMSFNSQSGVYVSKARAYINPQIVNSECIKNSLGNAFLGVSKIHVNPNFKGSKDKAMDNFNLTKVKNSILNCSRSNILKTQDSISQNYDEEKNSKKIALENPQQLYGNYSNKIDDKKLTHFKKVNFQLPKKYHSKYSWSREKHKNESNLTPKKNLDYVKYKNKVMNIRTNISDYSNEKVFKIVRPDIGSNLSLKKCPVYKSKTKIINKFKINLVKQVVLNKITDNKQVKSTSLPQKNMFPSKYIYTKSEKPIVRVANLVKNKYKYKKVSKVVKNSIYIIDKRKNISDQMKQKHNLKKQPDIKKLFPPNFLNKSRVKSRHPFLSSSIFGSHRNKYNWRKEDQSQISLRKAKNFPNKRVVNIGGILYKSTSNKLTLALSKKNTFGSVNKQVTSKSKGHIVYVKGEKFILDKNGKTLRRQKSNTGKHKKPINTLKRIDIGGVTYLQKSLHILIRTNAHQARDLVKRAKLRSIATLFKLRKRSSMNCMIYHKFGKCVRHIKGLCMYKHDPKNIAICKRYLKGNCDGTNCLLSHEVIQEKMAVCHFFLNGFCTKDNCPYLHVKLSKNAPICKNFLQGFCNSGKDCSSRHEYICPDFDKYGSCNLGSKCHYPHKGDKTKKEEENNSESCNNSERENNHLKYYIKSHHTFNSKKEKQSKKSFVKLKENQSNEEIKKTLKAKRRPDSSDSSDKVDDIIECVPKKIKLEKLPCYIPLRTD